jgi:hypothetical protein
MSARRIDGLAADLDGHRHHVRRGADVSLASGGDLTLGSDGNYFYVTPGAEPALKRIATANWLAGSFVVIHAQAAFAINSGTSAGDGFGSIITPGGAAISLAEGEVIGVSYDGEYWRTHNHGGGTSGVDDLNWTDAYSLDFSTLTDSNIKTAGDGAVTIDGVLWYARNTNNASDFALNPAGNGTYIRCNTNVSQCQSNSWTAPSLGVQLETLLGISLSSLMATIRRVRVWMQVDWVELMATAQEHLAAYVGYSQYTDGRSTNFTWAIRQWSGYQNATTFHQHRQHNSCPNSYGDDYQSWLIGVPQPSTRYDVYFFDWDLRNRSVVNLYGQYGTSWPVVGSMTYAGQSLCATNGYVNLPSGMPYVGCLYPWLGVAASSSGSVVGSANVLLKKIKVQTQK